MKKCKRKPADHVRSAPVFYRVPRSGRGSIVPVVFEVLFCRGYNGTGEEKQSDQVWNGHKTVQCIANGPDKIQPERRADDEYAAEENLVNQSCGLGCLVEEEFAAACAIQCPAQDCGESEKAEPNRDDDGTDDGNTVL